MKREERWSVAPFAWGTAQLISLDGLTVFNLLDFGLPTTGLGIPKGYVVEEVRGTIDCVSYILPASPYIIGAGIAISAFDNNTGQYQTRDPIIPAEATRQWEWLEVRGNVCFPFTSEALFTVHLERECYVGRGERLDLFLSIVGATVSPLYISPNVRTRVRMVTTE